MDSTGSKERSDEAFDNIIRRDGVSYKFDCKFIVGSDPNKMEIIHGCKHVFAVESPVFERMLFGDFQEAQNSLVQIPLPDDNPTTFRHFRLVACSCDRESCIAALSLEDTLNLIQFCHKYMALSITKLSTDRLVALCEDLGDEDTLKVFDVARLFPESHLLKKIVDMLVSVFPPVETVNELSQEAFNDFVFYHCRRGCFASFEIYAVIESYLKHNDLIPTSVLDDEGNSEPKIKKMKVDAFEEPTKTSCNDTDNSISQAAKKQRKFVTDLFENIDFSDMEATEFISGPGASNFLTFEQKYNNLCKCINAPF